MFSLSWFENEQTTLSKLRRTFKMSKITGYKIDAYVIPNSDPHMNEYLTEYYSRLKYVCGFSGRVGVGIATAEKAVLLTQSKYYRQAERELYPQWKLSKSDVNAVPDWLLRHLGRGAKVGSDPTLFNYNCWLEMNSKLNSDGILLIPLKINVVDLIRDNPVHKPQNITSLDVNYTGVGANHKLECVREKMVEKNAQVYIITALDEIAWLFNLRGSNFQYNPVFFSYVVLTPDLHLFVDVGDGETNIKNHFSKENIQVNLHSYDSIYSFISFMATSSPEIKKIWIPGTANYEIYSLVPEKKRFCEPSAVAILKAIKNPKECQGMVNAHIKDGVALCRFYSWLENSISEEVITESSAAEKLEFFRKDDSKYKGPSFATISSSGPNSAIIHYKAEPDNDRKLSTNEIYLCNSGGQYLCGTTDVTRTIHFGQPTEFQKDCFTRVLKGHIALATATFPNKTLGYSLDILARTFLWDADLDYSHGTGHGVGSYLYVHEGPIGISKLPFPEDPGLQLNMFITNEPGYYLENEFGMRIENVFRIVNANLENGKNGDFLQFKPITLCPIKKNLIKLSHLTLEEIEYLNNYHKSCFDILGPELKKKKHSEAYNWLTENTEAIQ